MRDIFTMPSNTQTHKDNRSKVICKRLGDRSVVLIGLMGSGKTAIGRRLATRLDIPFIDADKEIESGQNEVRDDKISTTGLGDIGEIGVPS